MLMADKNYIEESEPLPEKGETVEWGYEEGKQTGLGTEKGSYYIVREKVYTIFNILYIEREKVE